MLARLWAKPKTPQQLMDEALIELKTNVRQMQRARDDLDVNYCDLRDRARQLIEAGRRDEAKALARQMTRYRGAQLYMTAAIGRMEEAQIKIQLQRVTVQMQQSMMKATRALLRLNGAMPFKEMRMMMRAYDRETQTLDAKQELMDDAMDDAMAPFDDDKAEDELLQQVMDEIGMSVDLPMGGANNNNVGDEELQTRLNALRK